MERRLLSTWNQVAPRAYVRQWYCFAFRDDQSLEALETHLTLALNRLSKQFPDLTGKVLLLSKPKGRLCIEVEENGRIQLKVFDQRSSFGWTYPQLKAEGFPAKAFVDPSFDLPYQLLEDQSGIPVLELHLRVIQDGLLLGIYSHHSVSDGNGMDNYVGYLAELSKSPNHALNIQCPTDLHIDLPEKSGSDTSSNSTCDKFRELLAQCAEYSLLPSPTGPTQFSEAIPGMAMKDISKTGLIFVIENQQIEALKKNLARIRGGGSPSRSPSTFTCLAAITWAHVTKARLSSPKSLISSCIGSQSPPGRARIMLPIDWRRRAFTSLMESSSGNAIALPVTTIDMNSLMTACSTDRDAAYHALGDVTDAIDSAVHCVDEAFVELRTSLIRAAPDPRRIGLSADSRDPLDFYFNTWRHFGAQTCWKLPGLVGDANSESERDEGVTPDAIRRAQSDWNIGAGLILPGKKCSGRFEVLVTLDVDAMKVLDADASWKSWVAEVIE